MLKFGALNLAGARGGVLRIGEKSWHGGALKSSMTMSLGKTERSAARTSASGLATAKRTARFAKAPGEAQAERVD